MLFNVGCGVYVFVVVWGPTSGFYSSCFTFYSTWLAFQWQLIPDIERNFILQSVKGLHLTFIFDVDELDHCLLYLSYGVTHQKCPYAHVFMVKFKTSFVRPTHERM